MAAAVRFESAPPVGRVVIDRPEAKNALNLAAIEDFLAALGRADTEPGVRVVVLQGTGGDLSAGGDVRDMVARRGQAWPTYERLKTGLTAIVHGLADLERPVVAAVDGVCMGAGLGVALACDALLATKRSQFGAPFVKVGLVPDTGTSWLLPHMVGVQNARRLLLTGDPVDGEEAAALGLVTQVVADGPALDHEVTAWCRRFAALPATAVRDTKRLLSRNLDLTLADAIVHESMVQGLRFTSPEHAAAVDAFLAARRPK